MKLLSLCNYFDTMIKSLMKKKQIIINIIFTIIIIIAITVAPICLYSDLVNFEVSIVWNIQRT